MPVWIEHNEELVEKSERKTMNNEITIKATIEVDTSQLDEAIAKAEKLIALTKEHNQLVKSKKPYKPKGHKIIEKMQNDGAAICFGKNPSEKSTKKQNRFLKWLEKNYLNIRWPYEYSPTDGCYRNDVYIRIVNRNIIFDSVPMSDSQIIKFKYKDFPLKED